MDVIIPHEIAEILLNQINVWPNQSCHNMFIIYFNRGNNWFVPKGLLIFG